jgi:transglutaminase-like putative cysteine protease
VARTETRDVPEEHAQSLIDRLAVIPAAAREFDAGEREATLEFGLSPAVLSQLRAAGLSSSDGIHTFAWGDLHYLGLRLGSADAYVSALRIWRRSLERFAASPDTKVKVRCLPQLPSSQEIQLGFIRRPDGSEEEVTLQTNVPIADFEITLRETSSRAPAELIDVLDAVGELDFCFVPKSVRGDTAEARRTGLADCVTAAKLVTEGCERAGFPARVARGLMITLPFSAEHSWAEVLIDECWVPFDPLIIQTMIRFGGLPASHWPRSRPLPTSLSRFFLSDEAAPLVHRDGEQIATTFLTQIL